MFMSLELYKRSRNFKVSNTCRTLLLYTRATAFSHAGYSHPGLFDLQRYELDTLAFALAFFCEIAGLWWIVRSSTLLLSQAETPITSVLSTTPTYMPKLSLYPERCRDDVLAENNRSSESAMVPP
jgi:hypothetical protein